MYVGCIVDYLVLENDEGYEVDSVEVTCKRCDHKTQSYGDGVPSVKRCLALMREECPNDEENYYNAEGGEDEN